MRQSDNSEAVIRPLRRADIAVLADLWVAAWRATMPAIDFAARRGWIMGLLEEPAGVTLVAERCGNPIGFATLEGRYLHQLVVASDCRGDGTAALLLDVAKAKSPSGLVLDVNQANARAVRFYEREGFRRLQAGVNATSGLATWTMAWP